LKYQSYHLEAGIYSAGLSKKESTQKVIFGSIQSVARAKESFFKSFNLLIIDECHRVSTDENTQYLEVINKLKENNPKLCILGLTATPYRLGVGWIYQNHYKGEIKSKESLFFKNCIFDLPLNYMIKNNYLTQPVKVNIPVTCYDFSELSQRNRMYTLKEVQELLNKQKRLTPLIIKNIIDITESYDRKGVMVFSSTVKHAKEILSYLPEGEAQIILGDTEISLRDEIINRFKKKEFKYLVNVSVLTTGFDAPHVDVIAILRPTESVSLYQQIIGRGLRLDSGKKDCFILDYTGMGHDIYSPQIREKKPSKETEIVTVACPQCGFDNLFWGRINSDEQVIEHYGRTCKGASQDLDTLEFKECGYRFRYKICPSCGEQNDLTARDCHSCKAVLIDADSKLKQAKLSKNAYVMAPDSVEYLEKTDKNGSHYLEVRYYDHDGKYLSEVHFFSNETSIKKFNINFLRSHLKRPELNLQMNRSQEVIKYQRLLRNPAFIIARKQDKFWRITEKIFAEEF